LSGTITVPGSLTNGVKTIVITGATSGAQTFSSAFSVTSTATINLVQGWNLISLPLVPTNNTIAGVFGSGYASSIIAIWYLNYGSGSSAAPTWINPNNGLNTIDAGKAYWVYAVRPFSFTVTGTACGTSTAGGIPAVPNIPLYYSTSYTDGWNMLGFKSSQTSLKASDYLTSLSAGSYSPILYRYDGAWIAVGANDNLIPGAGYYIRLYASGIVLPPCN